MRWLIALALTALAAGVPANAQTEGSNLAASANGGKVVSATSEDAPEWGAANLIDGVKGRRGWSSVLQTGAPPQEVIVDLAGDQPVTIDRVVINVETGPEMLYGRFWAQDVSILVSSTDATPQAFQPVATVALEKTTEDQTVPLVPVPARFVKLRVNTVQGGAQGTHVEVGEMEVYAVGTGAHAGGGGVVVPAVTPEATTGPPAGQGTSTVIPVIPVVPGPGPTPTETPPVGPVTPVTPTETTPVGPVTPVTPTVTAPVGPVTPVTPTVTAPVGPVTPVTPTETTPVGPVTPVTPTGTTPVGPVTPVTPTETTPVGPVTPVTPTAYSGPEVNLAAQAAGGRVFATSFRDDYYTPDLLNDGLTGAEELDSYAWCSEKEPVYPQDLTVEFKGREVHIVSRVVVNSNTGDVAVFGDRWPRDVEVWCSTTGTEDGDFQKVATTTLKKMQENQVIDFPPTQARFVRLRVLSNYGHPNYVEVAEVEVWGTQAPATGAVTPPAGTTTTTTETTPAVGPEATPSVTPPTVSVTPPTGTTITIPAVGAEGQDLNSLIVELEQVLEKLKTLRDQGG